jgi:FHA domain
MNGNLKITLGYASAVLDAQNPRIFIGRDNTVCAIYTEDASVSRQHAEMFFDNGYAYIRDLGSSNGTWVDGIPVRGVPIPLYAGQQVFVGQMQLMVESNDSGPQKTIMCATPDALKQYMAAQQSIQQQPAPQAVPTGYQMGQQQPQYQPNAVISAPVAAVAAQPQTTAETIGLGGQAAPLSSDFKYRRQGSNGNGVLLIALRGDTFANDNLIEGFLEYTALDNETINFITIELVEFHKKGPKTGHVWDRVLVRQGPWKSRKGDVLPLPFKLRVPSGTAVTGRDVNWELRGYVDINWAFDIEATSPIMMKNIDLENIRDALGILDYRIVELNPLSLGQRYVGKFQPPAQLKKQLGISDINLDIEYLGANLSVKMEVEKTSLFKFDKNTSFLFDLTKLRNSTPTDLSNHFMEHINILMGK